MHILHVITTINRGGAQNHLASLVAEQVKQGHKIGVAYLKGDGYWEGHYKGLGVAVYRLELSSYIDIGCVLTLRRLIEVEDPTVVHAHMPPAELFCYMALMISLGKKRVFIASKHNDTRFCPNMLANSLETVIARSTDRIIAISCSVQKTVAEVIGNNLASKLRLVYYGFERPTLPAGREAHREAVRAELGIPSDAFVVGSMGRLVEQKAFDVLIRGYVEARKARRWSAEGRLLIVGEGPLEGNLKAIAAKTGFGDEIVWPGFREDAFEVLQAFDVFVLPSQYEGFGLVFLEAMAFGVPVIGTKVSAIPEVIGDAGLLVAPGSISELAAAIESLLDLDRRAALGRHGEKRAATFGLERMASLTQNVYVEALDESSVN